MTDQPRDNRGRYASKEYKAQRQMPASERYPVIVMPPREKRANSDSLYPDSPYVIKYQRPKPATAFKKLLAYTGASIAASLLLTTGALNYFNAEAKTTDEIKPDTATTMTIAPQAPRQMPVAPIETQKTAEKPEETPVQETVTKPEQPAPVVTEEPAKPSIFKRFLNTFKSNKNAPVRNVKLRADVDAAFSHAEKVTGLPYEVMEKTCPRESGCIPERINRDTQACGLFQFMPDQKTATLYEVTFKFARKHGYDAEADMVTSYVKNQHKIDEAIRKHKKPPNAIIAYAPKSAADKAALMQSCMNPEFNSVMFAENTLEKSAYYQEEIVGPNRKLTVGEYMLGNNMGYGKNRGLAGFAMHAWGTFGEAARNRPASEFFGKTISRQNPSLVKQPDPNFKYDPQHPKRKPRMVDMSIRTAYNRLITQHQGWGEVEVAALNNDR